MFSDHTPRLRNSLFLLLLGAGLMLVGGYYLPENWQVLVIILCGVMVMALGVLESYLVAVGVANETMRLENDRIREVANCPPERLSVLSYRVPELDFRLINGLPVPMWEGAVELEIFREFLRNCREDYVAPIREWGKSADEQRDYELILTRLLELGYVQSKIEGGTPRGPRSWLFKPGALKRLWADWIGWEIIFQGLPELS